MTNREAKTRLDNAQRKKKLSFAEQSKVFAELGIETKIEAALLALRDADAEVAATLEEPLPARGIERTTALRRRDVATEHKLEAVDALCELLREPEAKPSASATKFVKGYRLLSPDEAQTA